jgi:hypothetical protein
MSTLTAPRTRRAPPLLDGRGLRRDAPQTPAVRFQNHGKVQMTCAHCNLPVERDLIRFHVCRRIPPVPAWSTVEWPIPRGYRHVRAYASGTDLVVVGDPPYDESEDEAAHSCDENGCGQEHVLLRVSLSKYQQAKLARALPIPAPLEGAAK